MANHAVFSPSSLDTLALCAGKWAAEKAIKEAPGYVEEESKAATDGTRRHALAEWRQLHPAAPWPTKVMDDDGHVWDITSEDVELVKLATPYLLEHPALTDETCGKRYLEQKLEIGKYCGLPEGLVYGTADVVLISRREVEVVDFKFGRYPVDPTDWLQGKAYAIGAGALLDWAGLHRGVNLLKLTIVQPQDSPAVKTAAHNVNVMESWAKGIKGVVEAAQAPGAVRTPGDKQCHWCLAKDTCAARLGSAAQSMFEVVEPPQEARIGAFHAQDNGSAKPIPSGGVDVYEDSFPSAPSESVGLMDAVVEGVLDRPAGEVTADEIGHFLDIAPLIEGVIKDYRARAKKMLEHNEQVPGWKLVPGNNKRSWLTDNELEIEKGLKSCGLAVKDIYPKVIPSVPKMDAIMKTRTAKMRTRFGQLFKSEPGAPVLAPEGDKRPSITASLFEDETEIAPETAPTPESPALSDDLTPDWMK